MVTKYILLWVIVSGIAVCLSDATERHKFATKSHYPFYKEDETAKKPENCTVLHMNMVLRHGTRYPGKKDIKGINKMAEYINQFFTEETPRQYGDLILPWSTSFQHGDKLLAFKGEEEMYNISKRFAARFPSLFPEYFGERHYFVSTSTPRSSQSASAFAFGLFEGKGRLGRSKFQPISIMTRDLSDPVLRFYDACDKYKVEVSKNKTHSLKEFWEFKNGPNMQQVKKAIADRLNISEVTADHVQHMFLSCAYEVALYGKGQWCSVFEQHDFDIVEYLYDIKNYWKRGHGFKINYEMSCLLLRNLSQSVENAVKNLDKSHTLAIFHFAHAETIIPLLCILGLFNNTEPLLAKNYHKQKDRQFRTANMAPFSANVAVVLYSCKEDNNDSSFYVEILVNEQVAGLPCCDRKTLCPLNVFRNCFKDITDSCNLHEICSYVQNNSTSYHTEL